MRYLATVFFKRESGEWVQPGSVVDLGPEEASLWCARGAVSAYRTEMVKPPETRVSSIAIRRGRKNVIASNSH
jgi:hypothetical protein